MNRQEKVGWAVMAIGVLVLVPSLGYVWTDIYFLGPVRTDVELQTLSPWFKPEGSSMKLPRGSYDFWLMDDPEWPEDIEVSLVSGDERVVGRVPGDRHETTLGEDRVFLAAFFLYVPAGEWVIELELGSVSNGSAELFFQLDSPKIWSHAGQLAGFVMVVASPFIMTGLRKKQ